MVGITITPNVAPIVYDALAMCLGPAIACAKSSARVMVTLENAEHLAAFEQASAILETLQRILERQGSIPGGMPLH